MQQSSGSTMIYSECIFYLKTNWKEKIQLNQSFVSLPQSWKIQLILNNRQVVLLNQHIPLQLHCRAFQKWFHAELPKSRTKKHLRFSLWKWESPVNTSCLHFTDTRQVLHLFEHNHKLGTLAQWKGPLSPRQSPIEISDRKVFSIPMSAVRLNSPKVGALTSYGD